MSVMSIARFDGDPGDLFPVLQRHWRETPPQPGILSRIVAHGMRGVVVVERWETAAAADAAWSEARPYGLPEPDLEVFDVLARTGSADREGLRNWIELAIPDDAAWDERVTPRDA